MRMIFLPGLIALSAAALPAAAQPAIPDAPLAPDASAALIEQTGEGRYTLDPALFEDPTALSRQARVVPRYENGRFDGFKLFAIRPDSLWAKAGLKNGDIVRAANGRPLDSPNAALEAYAQAKGSGFVLDVERRGAPLRLVYTMRGQPAPAMPPSRPPAPAPAEAPASRAVARPEAAPGVDLKGRIRAALDLDFGDRPGEVRGRITLSSPALKARPGGESAGVEFSLFDLGAVDVLIEVEPGEGAPLARVTRLSVDGADLTVRSRPESSIRFQPGQGMDGRLDLRVEVTPGSGLARRMLGAMGLGGPLELVCSGRLSQPRCRLDRDSKSPDSSPRSP